MTIDEIFLKLKSMNLIYYDKVVEKKDYLLKLKVILNNIPNSSKKNCDFKIFIDDDISFNL